VPAPVVKSTTENENKAPKQKPDPFENPAVDLLVAEIPQSAAPRETQGTNDINGGGHIIVLNKFPVIPRHFILATKQFRNQTDLLEKEDLEATFACIRAWSHQQKNEKDDSRTMRRRLFAFFNSGAESGASQPHRHLQFLPVEDMRGQQEHQGSEESWVPLIDRVVAATSEESGFKKLANLPFKHFALPLDESASSDTLFQAYLALYRAAVEAAAAAGSSHWSSEEKMAKLAQTSGPSAISYNLAMTESAMMIVPRRSETAHIFPQSSQPPAEAEHGKVSLNGTILAGTLMVKQQSEWDDLRNRPDKINFLLAAVGIPVD
jgi:ATP adenylyltransferase